MEEVKVVKCKDCIYAGETLKHGMPKLICNNRVVGYVNPDFYCAEGEEEEEKSDASEES